MREFEKRRERWQREGTIRTHVLRDERPVRTRNKYGNKKTEIDGLQFDSQREADRWGVLKLMAVAGEIVDLDRQVRFDLKVNGQKICAYIADFTYRKAAGSSLIVEDVKGVKTRDYVIKKKLLKALHGIEVLET